MQQYVNEFNLLKHLPIMSLFEFRGWAKLVKDNDQITSLNILFIELRKRICNVLLDRSVMVREEVILLGVQWEIRLVLGDTENRLLVKIQKDSNVSHRGITKTNIEKALEKLDFDNIEGLFYDYLMELFLVSNFYIYNKKDNLRIRHQKKRTKNGITDIRFFLRSNYPLIVSKWQIDTP